VRLLRLASRPGTPGRGDQTPPERSDAELVAMAQERDPRAATLVWDRYAHMVRGILCHTVGPSADVDDLMQDVFVGFFKSVDSMRDPSALKSYLVGIAIRTARTMLRKKRVRRWLHLTDSGDLPETASPTEDPRARAAVRRLYALLDELDDRDRMAFVLRYAEGYELTEVASALGVSLATAKRSIARAEGFVLNRARSDVRLRDYVATEDLASKGVSDE
jgi:RNA polymerase sigma-70 factor (ECF subfamily)